MAKVGGPSGREDPWKKAGSGGGRGPGVGEDRLNQKVGAKQRHQ